ncbi:SH3-domain-containing protein [Laetiporus sulphureus 93-53]|uniref:SH3-domain-containing protein n=1 Tax=Laetiporus sulphureus 93-53 TaxID=1314785 RepID=A0A165E2D3_9APHY|nr:SH3-domain-containing protein [Laetiporus sulphureus 93-53]KZT06113.1 SH3-domain-containing protein [Laetiporus sulphureus 93-53]
MQPPEDPQAAALLRYVLSQTRQNIEFLASQDYLSPTDVADMMRRLPKLQDGPSVEDMKALTIAPPQDVPPPARRIPPPPPRTQRARAVWAYNEDGQEPNDLSFSAGEIVEIVDETNADWWTGSCRGRQGLFPSNHVEKLDTSSMPMPPPMPQMMSPMPPMPPMQAPPSYVSAPPEKPVYRPFGAVSQPMDQPPPPGAGVNSMGLQQAPQQEHKKSKFGRLGNTMANSAAGGVGFGAGAAIGSGLINAIF